MKLLKTLTILSLFLFAGKASAQYLPPSYQPMMDEIVENFKTITGSNSITKGKNTLSVVNKDKIALRIEHKKKVKNLTFVTQADEENQLFWVAANDLTIDMVNKYENDLTKILKTMYKLSQKKSAE